MSWLTVSATIQARGADKLGWCEAHDDDYCPPSPGAAAGKGAGQDEVGRERKRQKKDKSAGSRGGGGKRTRVLEVGSGCGLLGLVLSRLGCDVTLTEVPEALQNLKLNVKANMKESEEGEGEGRRARAFQLDWTREADVEEVGKGMGGGYDVVVGTDVVFSKALVDPLLRCIHSLSGPHTTVWLCLNERCRDAHAELLKRAGLFFDLVDRSEQLRETDGCSSAEELELFLFRLTRRKESPPPPPSPPAKK
jgi:hypothetical protein